MTQPTDATVDPFAAIAAQGIARKTGLVAIAPLPIPARSFAAQRGYQPFRPVRQPGSAADLVRLLAVERRRMAKFQRQLAPAVGSPRLANRLDRFAWRLEEDADRADAQRVLRGDGSWQEVTVPHYGPPTGLATALYRTTFTITTGMLAMGCIRLRFGAADYRAHVFVNGRYLGSHEGLFAPFDLDATTCVNVGANTLVVRLENDGICLGNGTRENPIGDKLYAATGPGWDEPGFGWHHCPPGMGLWRPVVVEACAPTHVQDIFVRPLEDLANAEAWIELACPRASDRWQQARLRFAVFGSNFAGTAIPWREIAPQERLGSGRNDLRIPLALPAARRWTPDTPWLYELQVEVLAPDGTVLDRAARCFGMRSFRIDADATPKGRLLLNGCEIRLRGANTMGYEQLAVMRGDDQRLVEDMLLARVCRMNFLRITQRPVQPEVYDCCDRLGILVQTDLPLFGQLRRPQFCEAVRQAEEMERLIRAHPSCILVSYINEPMPWGMDMRRQLSRPELESFFVAADQAVRLANPDRAIKPIDGDYDPPGPGLPDQHCYTLWYNGHGLPFGQLHRGHWMPAKPGWMVGCGEFGAEGLDFPDLMRRRYPAAWLPTPGDPAPWTPERIAKAQSAKLQPLLFERPLPAEDQLEAWCARSQAWQARATRLMTEALRRLPAMNTFAIHLFIDAWPAGWMKTIMDCERRPKPAFWAYREALAPLHASIRSDRFGWTGGERFSGEAWICNDGPQAVTGVTMRWQVEIDGRVLGGGEAPTRIPRCAPTCQGRIGFPLPAVQRRSIATVHIVLIGSDRRRLAENSLDIAVHPSASGAGLRVAACGGTARRLLRELGLRPVPIAHARAVVVDPSALAAHRAALERLVATGGSVLVLAPPVGRLTIAGDELEIVPASLGSYDFAARVPSHPLCAGLEEGDLHFWYDESAGMITPYLHAVCEPVLGWSPVLLSGAGQFWGGPGLHEAYALCEKRVGDGVWRLAMIDLAGRVRTNPAARRLALRALAWPE